MHKILGSTMLGMLLCCGVTLHPANAAQATTGPTSFHLPPRHDLSHPMLLGNLNWHNHRGTLRSMDSRSQTLSWLGPVPLALPPTLALSTPILPLDENPFRVCTNGVAYAQGETVNGQTRWWIGGSVMDATAYVVYYWCPNPFYAPGYNFTYTVEWFHHSDATTWPQYLSTGEYIIASTHTHIIDGAGLQRQEGTVTGDGESAQTYALSVGEGVYDYSTPQDGRFRYLGFVRFDGLDVSAGPPSGVPLVFTYYDPTYI